MTSFTKTALLPYSPEQLYQLVLKVEEYPLFLPWCTRVVLHAQDEFSQEATVYMKKGLLTEQFRTHNILVPNESITMRLVEGPFKALTGEWKFLPLEACKTGKEGISGTQISFHVAFEVKGGPLHALLEMGFKHITQTLLQAFCQRSHEVFHCDPS